LCGVRTASIVLVLVAALSGCGGGVEGSPPGGPAGECADVVAAEAEPEGGGTWSFRVTVRSADTGWDQYADAWEVAGPDGTVYGTRVLTHPHVEEQPFTRSLSGVEIPAEVRSVTVRARDSVAGFCGEAITVEVGS
jgi:hypothetical protein